MTIETLRYFVQAYNCKSFSQAAMQLTVSSQGLTRAIASMEQELKVQLFTRTPSGIEPTYIASKLYPKALLMIEIYGDMETIALNDIQKTDKILRLQYYQTAYTQQIINKAKYLARLHNIRLEVTKLERYTAHNQGAFVDLEKETCDIELAPPPAELQRGYCYTKVIDIIFYPVIDKMNSLSNEEFVSFDDLSQYTFYLPDEDSVHGKDIIQHCINAGFTPKCKRFSDDAYVPELINGSPLRVVFRSAWHYKQLQKIYPNLCALKSNPPVKTPLGMICKKKMLTVTWIKEFIHELKELCPDINAL